MYELMDIITWQVWEEYKRVAGSWEPGKGISVPDRLVFLESAVLCGVQMAQRTAGITPKSPRFVVKVGLSLKRRGGRPTGKISGWYIYRKDGTCELLPHKPMARKRRTKTAPKRGKKKVASADAGAGPLFQTTKASGQ